MKFAVFADPHIGPTAHYKGVQRKLTEFAEPFIQDFVQAIAKSGDCDFVVQLGDLIQDESPEKDRERYERGVELFRSCPVPVHHVLGNHDVKQISLETLSGILGTPRPYYSFERNGFHFVILYSTVPNQEDQRSLIPPEQVNWLKQDLSSGDSPTVVFVHHSLSEQDLTGNAWFEGRAEGGLVENREEVRCVLESSRRVVAVMNGHLHWNHFEVHNDIAYITIQSATENFQDDGTPANTWGVVELGAGELFVTVFGNDPAYFSHRFTR